MKVYIESLVLKAMELPLIITMQEMILILIALVILIIWGPTKIPQLARSIGEAVREFKKGAKGEEELEPELRDIAKILGIDVTGKSRDEVIRLIKARLEEGGAGVDRKLAEIAERLGIDVKGKSDEEIIREITWRLSKK